MVLLSSSAYVVSGWRGLPWLMVSTSKCQGLPKRCVGAILYSDSLRNAEEDIPRNLHIYLQKWIGYVQCWCVLMGIVFLK